MIRSHSQTSKKYSETFLESLHSIVEIEAVIGDYVDLSKKSSGLVGLCPFHSEKTPSFHVSPSKKVFHCFGCKKGGDVIEFLKEKEGYTFVQAIRVLCDKFKIQIPSSGDETQTSDQESRALILEMNKTALEFWVSQLKMSESAKRYLDERGLSQEIIEEFQLGFATDSWDSLKNHLTAKKYTFEQMQISGLFSENKSGSLYDRFRNRLIIPILDTAGNVVAFGGRDLSGKDSAKYINSPETEVYTKGEVLFGLRSSREHIKSKKFAILTEGYFDAISLYQKGIKNVVASLGTAFTPLQCDELKRYTDKVVVCYDGDESGQAAGEKASARLVAKDFSVKVLVLHSGSDPDEFIRTHEKKEFDSVRSKAPTWFEFLTNRSANKYDMSDPKQKAKVVEEVLSMLHSVRNDVERREYFTKAMSRLSIDESLHDRLWSRVLKQEKGSVLVEPGYSISFAKVELLNVISAMPEKRRSAIAVVRSEISEKFEISRILDAIDFDKNINYDEVSEQLNSDEQTLLRESLIRVDDTLAKYSDLYSQVSNCIKAIKKELLEKQLKNLSEEMVMLDFSDVSWKSKAGSIDTMQKKILSEIVSLGV